MKKKRRRFLRLLILFIAIWLITSVIKYYWPISISKISRMPKPEKVIYKTLKSIPTYDPNSYKIYQVDLQSCDLSSLDLRNNENDLMHAVFDTTTKWPSQEKLPTNFDWQKIIELGKNPGLGLRDLHKQGITGKGVGVAIIDNPLLVNHVEYADRLRVYEENMDVLGLIPIYPAAHMHGPGVTSIIAGRNTGVAPEADIYYFARWVFDTGAIGIAKGLVRWEPQISLKKDARFIYRILEINKRLPKEKRIRVISISMGWWSAVGGYGEINKAVQKAKEQGVLVLCSTMEENYSFDFHGLERFPLNNPDDYKSYQPGAFMKRAFLNSSAFSYNNWLDGLLVPMGSRTVASSKGVNEYRFSREGGRSWAIPYVAGLYALMAQVDPNITPERFWALAIRTGDKGDFGNDENDILFGWIVNPQKLAESIRAGELVDANEQTIELEKRQKIDEMDVESKSFKAKLCENINSINFQNATSQNVIEILGKPLFYMWRMQILLEDNLPEKYYMFYPNGVRVLIVNSKLVRIEFFESGYVFADNIHIGSPIKEVLEKTGIPDKVVEYDDSLGFRDFEDGTLYRKIFNNDGWYYYAPKGLNVKFYFKDNKLASMCLTSYK